MGKVWARWWGHRTADIAYHAVLTLAHIPGSTREGDDFSSTFFVYLRWYCPSPPMR
jgi:hypothetical protein